MATQEISAFSNFSGTNEQGYVIVGGSNGVEGGKKLLSDIVPVVPEQVQADWEQDDDTQKDYIKNKPTVEDGAQVNKIEGILLYQPHIEPKVLPIEDKLVALDFGTGALIDSVGNLDFHCTAPLLNGESSDGGAMLLYDNTLTLKNNALLSVANPVPDTDNANNGDVLTYNSQSDEIVWAAPQGGSLPIYDSTDAGKVLAVNQAGDGVEWTTPQGGGGNPYTKTTVTSGNRYTNGKVSVYGFNLFDQDITIANNTYSIVSTPLGYAVTDYPDSSSVDTLKIKLPSNTDFPMAVVEFNIYQDNKACVNNIEVYIGDTKLNRLYDTPYNENLVMVDEDNDIICSRGDNNGGMVHYQGQYNNYWYMKSVDSSYVTNDYTAFVGDNDKTITIQIQIFGNCFSVKSTGINGVPAAS